MRDHVVTVRSRAIADDLGEDFRAARPGVPEFLEHQHAGAAGDDEAVALHVIGARGLFGRSVELGGHGAHGIKQVRHGPVEILMAAGEDDVLLAHLDLLVAIADAMLAGRAGGGDRIIDALDAEGRRERRGGGRAHRLGHGGGADALGAALAGDFGGLDDRARRGAP
jgi:hypothetical protein